MAVNEMRVTMSGDLAREMVIQINDHLTQAGNHLGMARQKLYQLKELSGWVALGYKSWRECVTKEFHAKQAQCYRQLKAAEIEMNITPDSDVGSIPERVLRPLSRMTPEQQKIAYDFVSMLKGGGRVTSGDTQAVSEAIREWQVTGAFQDGTGEQLPLGERLSADVIGRIYATRERQQLAIQDSSAREYKVKGGTGRVMAVTPLQSGKFRVVMEFESEAGGWVGGQEYKLHVWE